ncbi:hypothetical protein MKW98_031898, partial [Papaver atlanticum]
MTTTVEEEIGIEVKELEFPLICVQGMVLIECGCLHSGLVEIQQLLKDKFGGFRITGDNGIYSRFGATCKRTTIAM